MGLPGKRRSASAGRRRRAHNALDKIVLIKCSHCKKPMRSHRVCPACGYYKGKEVVKAKIKKTKKTA
jgi:large subunit ribosomal protein L32